MFTILYTELHYLSSHFFFFESRCLKMFLQDMPSQVFCQYGVRLQEVGSPKSRQPFAQGQVVMEEEEEEEEEEKEEEEMYDETLEAAVRDLRSCMELVMKRLDIGAEKTPPLLV